MQASLQYVLFFMVVDTFAKETPSMTLNSRLYPNGSEVELAAGSSFTLYCHGNGSAGGWSSSAFSLRLRDSLGPTLEVGRSKPRHTGTYRCGDAWIHLYVRDSANPASAFEVPKRIPNLEEGRDFLLECLVTDPSFSQLTLRREREPGGLPLGMVVTFDPQRGALIRNVSPAFSGSYVCSAQKDGQEFTSKPLYLVVTGLRDLPVVSIGQDSFIRVVGESLEITCLTTNPDHRVSVTWTHTHLQGLALTEGQEYKDKTFYKNLTLTLPAVQGRHGGRYTCTAKNQAGVATATANLTVVDAPYLRVYLLPVRQANVSTAQMTVRLVVDASANSTFSPSGANGSAGAAPSVVEVWEGRDVRLAFLTEAYPPLRHRQWDTPWLNNTSLQESTISQPDRLESWLLLRKVRFEDRGKYTFCFSSLVSSGNRTIDLRVYRSPTAVIKPNGNQTLVCSSSGYPLPELHWYRCPWISDTCGDHPTYQLSEADQSGETKELNGEVHRELALTFNGDNVTVECVARSKMGESRVQYYVPVLTLPSKQDRPPPFFNSILIGSSSAAVLLLLLLLALLYKYKQKPRYEIRWKIIDVNQGNEYTFIDPTQLPYNDMKWEFPREQLQLGLVVGAGAFGKVVEATAYGLGEEDSIKKVAVKMLKPSAHSEESEALMSELKILSHLGYHDNIVNLLGACTRGGPMLMITEYCYNGDLLNFLRGRASISAEEGYKNMEGSSRSDSGISCSEYQEMQQGNHPHGPHTLQGEEDGRFSLLDLFQYSYQVAQGMDFLSSRNCIHRDVAARNVLLTEFRVAKICDFGLARDITDDDNYIIKGNARLPVKWMSPESIFQCVYTTQSDVWSYGVLLWEIFSLGQSPYPNVVVDAHFYKMIKAGRHMSKPDFATAEIYQLMIGCWNLEPTHRPTFTEIGQLIKNLLSTNEAQTHQNDPRSDLDREQGVRTADQRLKSETEDGPLQDVFEEADPLLRTKMRKNVYH
ncbi:macrophage colony-stimulating factor 1 receptor 2 isoform X1 [Gadus chalcogrammus]|uniref:macrophage colony-stimulating factor 1 receptor 2 isoform X1 n=1 Tax=Gadus chalcogrammus TaxID=1042646 RepID=UPI0024C42008|nr:macrophage colony-stimulating factor 1 receptor 2 isoform X1 [Gadus chalcogrammus]